MATYAIGDIQGCFRTFLALLERTRFDDARDRLWFTGDLVNRGPRSLETLRWAAARGDRDVCVLGNHDLNLLAVACGVRRAKKSDTLDAVLDAPDREELLGWLRARPLLHREGDRVLVHAGLAPEWTLDDAEAAARMVEAALREDPERYLGDVFSGRHVDRWRPDPGPRRRAVFATEAFTRMRVLCPDGTIDRGYGGKPGEDYAPGKPWYAVPHRRGPNALVVFGHWSSLGFLEAPGAICLDSGCVWGNSLTAYRLDDGAVFTAAYAD